MLRHPPRLQETLASSTLLEWSSAPVLRWTGILSVIATCLAGCAGSVGAPAPTTEANTTEADTREAVTNEDSSDRKIPRSALGRPAPRSRSQPAPQKKLKKLTIAARSAELLGRTSRDVALRDPINHGRATLAGKQYITASLAWERMAVFAHKSDQLVAVHEAAIGRIRCLLEAANWFARAGRLQMARAVRLSKTLEGSEVAIKLVKKSEESMVISRNLVREADDMIVRYRRFAASKNNSGNTNTPSQRRAVSNAVRSFIAAVKVGQPGLFEPLLSFPELAAGLDLSSAAADLYVFRRSYLEFLLRPKNRNYFGNARVLSTRIVGTKAIVQLQHAKSTSNMMLTKNSRDGKWRVSRLFSP